MSAPTSVMWLMSFFVPRTVGATLPASFQCRVPTMGMSGPTRNR
jgi:hypothetical protein